MNGYTRLRLGSHAWKPWGSPAAGIATAPSQRLLEHASELVAIGDDLGDREIAEALFITTKTVEIHLRHAYAKLGVRIACC